MKLPMQVCAGAALFLAVSVSSLAQQTSPGYHAVACYKLKPEEGTAFQKWAADEMSKVAQGRIDDGEITSFYLLRAVFPQGEGADCDYLVVTFFPNMPLEFGPEQVEAAVKKAGFKFTGAEYFARRDALVRLVSVELFQNVASAGSEKKGDYVQVNYFRLAAENQDDWVEWQKTVWRPVAEAMVKDGRSDGWSVNLTAMPFGTDLPYQAVTVDIFPNIEGVFGDDSHFMERFKKVYPDRELGTTFAKAEKLGTRARVDLYVLDEFFSAAH